MAEPSLEGEEVEEQRGKEAMLISRKEKRKERKKMKRKQTRREMAEKEKEEDEKRLNDPEEQRRFREMEEEERQRMERDRLQFQERERLWMEAMEGKRKEEQEKEEQEEEERRKILEQENEAKRLERDQVERETECNEDDDWEYVEEGPPEIIWQGNEIIFRKKKVRVRKKNLDEQIFKEDVDRPTSNPLPPQSEAFAEYQNAGVSAQQVLENVAQQVPNFGTEQDKAHCPFHLKTGACRFGQRCSRVHFYPDKSCTLLIKNMYNGPGLAWEQDEGLEYTDEEVERCYEEFYEDVHTEFLKYGEIINFKACRNGTFHLRGNVYVHYKSLDSAVLAFQSFNGRYFAGRQVKCEFVNVTRWKVAICGEFMKTRLKTCSHGMACNFLHCFRNPGGDYEWADWDKPPPKYWVRKMASLFGYSDESACEKTMEEEKLGQGRTFGKTTRAATVRYHSLCLTRKGKDGRQRHHARNSRSRELDRLLLGDYESDSEEGTDLQRGTNNNRKQAKIHSKPEGEENINLKIYCHRERGSHESEYDGDHPARDIDRERENDSRRHHLSKRSKRHVEVSECSTRYQTIENRTEKVHSDDEWLDGGRNRERLCDRAKSLDNETKVALDSKRRPYVSNVNQSEGDRDVEQHCSRRERGSRHQGMVQSPDNGSSGELQFYGDKDKDSHRHHRYKSLVHQKNVLESQDDHWDGRYRGHDTDYSDDQLDRNRGRGHSCTRKRSRDSKPWSSDDELSPKRLKERSHCEKSESGRSFLKRNPTICHSRRRNHSSRESGEAEIHKFSEVDQYYGRSESIDHGSRGKTGDQDRWEPGSSPGH